MEKWIHVYWELNQFDKFKFMIKARELINYAGVNIWKKQFRTESHLL